MPNHPGSIDNVIEHLPDSIKLNFKDAVEVFVDKIGKQNWYLGLCLFKAVAKNIHVQPHAKPTLFLSTEEVAGAATGSTINEPSCSSAYVDPSLFLIEIHIFFLLQSDRNYKFSTHDRISVFTVKKHPN
jgi:hypothetical protein